MRSFRELGVRARAGVVLLSLWMNCRIVFGWKMLLFLTGTAIYFVVFCLIRASMDEPITLGTALAWLVWLPTTVFGVFFAMDLVARERDAGLLETIFTVSVSLYRVWIIKFAVLMLSVTLLALALIALTDRIVIELPVMLTLVYVLPPLVFFAALTVLFSVVFKSANAAGLCMAAVLGFVLLVSRGGISTTRIFPYLNPFDMPPETEVFNWVRTVLYNKVGYVVLGGVWFWRALRWLDRRERLLQ